PEGSSRCPTRYAPARGASRTRPLTGGSAGPANRPRSRFGHTAGVVEDERPTTSRRDGAPQPGAPEQPPGITELRDQVPDKLRDVSFPSAVRGYDRHAVDTYVKEVNAVIAELEVGRSPRAA